MATENNTSNYDMVLEEIQPNGKSPLPFRESHAFMIGIDKYRHWPKLRTAVNDANAVAIILEKEQQFRVHPPLLNASKDAMKELVEKTIPEKVTAEDRCVLYFAGHGIAIESEEVPEGYLIPADALPEDISGYYPMRELYAAIKDLPCNHFLLILDCCFAGVLKWWTRYRGDGSSMLKCIFKERFDRFVKDPAWQVITSAASDQMALDRFPYIPIGNRDYDPMNHSLFANALIEGLRGAADIIPKGTGDGVITATELYLFIREQMELPSIELNEKRRQTPGIFTLEKHDKGEFIFLNPNHILNLPANPNRSPYKGLAPFDEKDTDLFYGRECFVKELLNKINKLNLVVVTGASGCGKSSVVRAGVLPELRQQEYKILPVLRPGEFPVDSLNKILQQSILNAGKKPHPTDWQTILTHFVAEKTVLVIDQLEELITLCRYKDKREQFFIILKDLLDADKNNLLKIIITVRADFEPHFFNTVLKSYWKDARCTPPLMTTGELREVIQYPVLQEVMDIEPPALIDQIIDEVNQSPGALPLLSFTLDEWFRLYKEGVRNDRTLTGGDYKELGGVIGALSSRADSVYKALTPKHRETLPKILLRMVSVEGNELAGKKVLLNQLEFSQDDENKRVEELIHLFLEARLILKNMDENKQTYIEPAHDALIRSWGTLQGWLNGEGKARLLMQNRLTNAVQDYLLEKQKSGKGKLWNDDRRLDQLQAELGAQNSFLNKVEKKFIEDSIALKKKKKNTFIATAIGIIAVLSVLLIWAIIQGQIARREQRIAQSNYLASQAQLRIENDPAAAISLAQQAYLMDDNNNVSQVLSAAASQTLEHPLYNTNFQHDYHVNSAIFSPAGDRILTSSEDKTVKLWDLRGKLLLNIPHEQPVSVAVFSPDGLSILTLPRDKAAKLWDLQGNLLQQFKHENRITTAIFSPNGHNILTASIDNTAKLWSVQGKLLMVVSHQDDIHKALFSPDGTRILTISKDLNAGLWDLQGNPLYKLYGVIASDFSADGKYMAFVLFNNTIKVWQMETNSEKVFRNFARILHLVKFSPDNRHLLIAYLGGRAELLDFDGQLITSFGLHKGNINSALFSFDGSQLLTASKDNTAKLWNLNGKLIADLYLHKDNVIAASFSPDSTRILTASGDNTAKLWDLKNQLLTQLPTSKEEVKVAGFSPDQRMVITISGNNTVQLWNLRGNLLANLKKHAKTVHSALFSPDGTRILTASADNTATLWDLEGHAITDFNQHTDNVNAAVFSPDGHFVLTASYDHTAQLWDLQGNRRQRFRHQKEVISARFSPDGQKILTASFDETAKLWDIHGNLLTELNDLYGHVTVAIFSPDGTKVLTVSASTTLWDMNGKSLCELNIFKYQKGKQNIEENQFVNSAVFSPDSQRVLTIHDDNTARLWNQQGNVLTQLAHNAKIYTAVFSADGTRIVTASADKTIKLWDLSGNLLSTYDKHTGVVYSVVFSPDSCRIISASEDKTVKLWYTPNGIIPWLARVPLPSFQLTGTSNQQKNKGDE